MRESLEAVIAHGFAAMDLHRIEAVVDTDNGASSGLLRRLGFTHEGVRRALLGSFGSIPAMPEEFVRLLDKLR